MKYLKADFQKIYQDEHFMLILMILNLLTSFALIIFSLINLNPDSAIVKVGYGDIGGYRDGSWSDFLTFPLLGLLFGVVHNFLALRVFHKRGAGMTKFFLLTTLILIIGAFIVLVRLLGEG